MYHHLFILFLKERITWKCTHALFPICEHKKSKIFFNLAIVKINRYRVFPYFPCYFSILVSKIEFLKKHVFSLCFLAKVHFLSKKIISYLISSWCMHIVAISYYNITMWVFSFCYPLFFLALIKVLLLIPVISSTCL